MEGVWETKVTYIRVGSYGNWKIVVVGLPVEKIADFLNILNSFYEW
jgi:hypothetical protein